MANIQATPWSTREKNEATVKFQDPAHERDEPVADRITISNTSQEQPINYSMKMASKKVVRFILP